MGQNRTPRKQSESNTVQLPMALSVQAADFEIYRENNVAGICEISGIAERGSMPYDSNDGTILYSVYRYYVGHCP